jgi:ABC-type bacteriocin/lantibiotic exporter with double-glycine peptidase domain
MGKESSANNKQNACNNKETNIVSIIIVILIIAFAEIIAIFASYLIKVLIDYVFDINVHIVVVATFIVICLSIYMISKRDEIKEYNSKEYDEEIEKISDKDRERDK